MFTSKHALIASLITVFIAFHPHVSSAESFKGSEFLTWETESQYSYVETAIGIAGLIATLNDKEQAACIETWYYKNKTSSTEFVLDTMRNHPSYHPRGVVMSVLQKKCGSFAYK